MIDESTFGFNKADAEQLVGLIGMADVEFEELKPPARNSNAIIDLRLNGNDLQYTKDGVNWVTWHTATECPP